LMDWELLKLAIGPFLALAIVLGAWWKIRPIFLEPLAQAKKELEGKIAEAGREAANGYKAVEDKLDEFKAALGELRLFHESTDQRLQKIEIHFNPDGGNVRARLAAVEQTIQDNQALGATERRELAVVIRELRSLLADDSE